MINEGVLNIHTLNQRAYQGITPYDSLHSLIFRLKLDESGSLNSFHPTVSGSFFIEQLGYNVSNIASFKSGSSTISNGLYSGNNPVSYSIIDDFQLVSTPQTGVNQRVTNKVFIAPRSEFSGSTLSPFVSTQKFNQNISRNALDIEVAFSPTDNIDSDITNQLGAFNIGDYIGDPGYAKSSSYGALDDLRNTYFEKYTSSYDIQDYVRLIKYYDNSLFKMIKDFVPARANLSTGIVVKPSILERSKFARHEPIFTFVNYSGSIDIGNVTGSAPGGIIYTTSFTEQVITPLGTITQPVIDNSANFTGEFGGNLITQSNYFPQYEVSTLSQEVLTKYSTSQYITTSFNYLRNNVTGSRTSSYQLDLDYSTDALRPVNYNFVTGRIFGNLSAEQSSFLNAEIQDSDYTSFVHNSSRYYGSKTSSSLYNTYSLADDKILPINKAYGKTFAIGHYTRKIGLFTQIVTSSFLLGRNDTTFVYLVDESGSFTELNQDNRNWEEVQNTFKAGRKATIRLFDNQKFGDQKTTDGIKATFNSGYTYSPTLYFSSSDSTMSFDIVADSRANMFKATSAGGYITQYGSSSQYHHTSSANGVIVYDLFKTAEINYNDGSNYASGIFTAPSATASFYTVPETAQYGFSLSNLNIAVAAPSASGVGYRFFITSSNNAISSKTGYLIYTGSSSAGWYANGTQNRRDIIGYGPPTVTSMDSAEVYLADYGSTPVYSAFGVTSSYYPWLDFGFGPQYADWNIIDSIDSGTLLPSVMINYTFSNLNLPQPDLTGSVSLNLSIPAQQLTAGVVLKMYLERTRIGTGPTEEYVAPNAILISSPKGGNPVANPPYIVSTGSAEFCLSSELTTFQGNLFLPEGVGINPPSALYSRYGNVEYTFNPLPGDLLIVSSSANLEYSYEIINSVVDAGELCLEVQPTIANQLVDGTQKIEKFLILKKVVDETNAILSFNKRPGQTSYGFLIPDNLSPDVLKNINVITAQVQAKILSVETNNNNILNGGNF